MYKDNSKVFGVVGVCMVSLYHEGRAILASSTMEVFSTLRKEVDFNPQAAKSKSSGIKDVHISTFGCLIGDVRRI